MNLWWISATLADTFGVSFCRPTGKRRSRMARRCRCSLQPIAAKWHSHEQIRIQLKLKLKLKLELELELDSDSHWQPTATHAANGSSSGRRNKLKRARTELTSAKGSEIESKSLHFQRSTGSDLDGFCGPRWTFKLSLCTPLQLSALWRQSSPVQYG